MNENRPARDAALFLQLVLGLSQSAMIALGKLQNPITRKIETDLEAARATIDTLAALEARTRGNLDAGRHACCSRLASLRLNYVDVMSSRRTTLPRSRLRVGVGAGSPGGAGSACSRLPRGSARICRST